MRFQRRLARFHRRYTNSVVALISPYFLPLGTIHNVGRLTGRRYTTPAVVIFSRGQAFVMLNYGLETHWVKNVLDASEYELSRGGYSYLISNVRTIPSNARQVPLYMRIVGYWPKRRVLIGIVGPRTAGRVPRLK
jgi:hypothetical protein